MSINPDYFSTAMKKTAALFKKDKTIDEEIFKQLLNPVKENIYNFIYKALNFAEDADDVYQETVLRAFNTGTVITGKIHLKHGFSPLPIMKSKATLRKIKNYRIRLTWTSI